MSKVAIEGNVSGSGTLTISAPNTNSNFTLSLPTNTGTIITQNSTPAFASTIGVGGATAAASGAGITFPATQSASSDANTLDDYEEGTWTPTISGFLTNPTLTYSTRVGTYTKIGRVVTITCSVQPGSVSVAGTGNLQFTGLPFTCINTADFVATGVSNQNGNFNWGTNKTAIVFSIATNSSTISVFAMQNSTTEAGIPVTNFNDSNKYLSFSITYFTA
jgi:hypothetical protein